MNPQDDGALRSRGSAYSNKGDYDRAIQDFNEVIRINPRDGPRFALSSRGNAYKGKGDYDRALQDFNEALRLNPKDPAALVNRGTIFYERADFQRAVQDFGQAVQVLSADDYRRFWYPYNYFTVLWAYLARARGGGEAAGELKQNALRLDQAKWPGPIIRLYLGDLTPEDVWQAAQDPDPKKNVDNACSANFFIGEYERLHGKNSEAVTLLRKAKDTCPPNFKERLAAQSELAQLEKLP
jgi:lipoprotein NlpI